MPTIRQPHVQAFLARVHPGLRKTQRVNLLAVVCGILLSGKLQLSAVARCTPGAVRLIHRIKRVHRFIDNPRLSPTRLGLQLAYANWQQAARQARPCVLMDYTDLGDGYLSLWTALAYRGRSVPLLCWTLPKTQALVSRNALEHEMLLLLRAHFGTGWVLVADRGFARASLLQMLNQWQIDYVIRIDDNTMMHTPDGRTLAGKLRIRGRRRFLPQVGYHSDLRVPINLLLCGRRGARWNLATSLTDPQEIFQCYQRRMQIEEMFRDLKQHLGLERMRSTTLQRRAMWLVLAAIAYSYLYWLGRVAQQAGLSERYHYWKSESQFWLGLQLFRHNDPDLTTLLARWLKVPKQSG